MVRVTRTDTCWLWNGSVDAKTGYGKFPLKQSGDWKSAGAHRASYLLFVGPIMDGLYVCHICDVRHCVNPKHLWLGTHQQNQADMGRKGRAHSPAKKLSDAQVADIRMRHANGETRAKLASEFSVYPAHISRIVLRSRRK